MSQLKLRPPKRRREYLYQRRRKRRFCRLEGRGGTLGHEKKRRGAFSSHPVRAKNHPYLRISKPSRGTMTKLTSFEADIRPLFTDRDIKGMMKAFNLAHY